jgi:hypothetical protein
MRASVYRFFQTLNSVSIDVTIGAMCCGVFFSKLLNAAITADSIVLLGLSVWILYTVDHLLDARKIITIAATHRHRFHQENNRPLRLALVVAIVVACLLLARNREYVVPGGLLLAVVVSLNVLVQRYAPSLKEIFVSVLYTVGVLMPVWVASGMELQLLWVVVIQLALTALLNLLMFSHFDATNDLHHGFTSFTVQWGRWITERCCWFVFALCCSLTLLSPFVNASLVICAMATLQLVPLVSRKYFEVTDRYRLLGDGAFMLPAVWVLF